LIGTQRRAAKKIMNIKGRRYTKFKNI